MGSRRRALTGIYAAEMALAAVMVSAPAVFPECGAPMHCHYSWMAEIGTAAVVMCAALLGAFSRGMETPRMMSLVTAVCGVFTILYPTALIGVCQSPRMPCHYGLLPVWKLAGGALVLLSIIVFFAAREDRV